MSDPTPPAIPMTDRIRRIEQQREVDIQTLADALTDHRYRIEALESRITRLEEIGEARPSMARAAAVTQKPVIRVEVNELFRGPYRRHSTGGYE